MKTINLIILLLCSCNAAAITGIALVIGNNDYQQAPLKNPRNDALAVANKLVDMDYHVIRRFDADRSAMRSAKCHHTCHT